MKSTTQKQIAVRRLRHRRAAK